MKATSLIPVLLPLNHVTLIAPTPANSLYAQIDALKVLVLPRNLFPSGNVYYSSSVSDRAAAVVVHANYVKVRMCPAFIVVLILTLSHLLFSLLSTSSCKC